MQCEAADAGVSLLYAIVKGFVYQPAYKIAYDNNLTGAATLAHWSQITQQPGEGHFKQF